MFSENSEVTRVWNRVNTTKTNNKNDLGMKGTGSVTKKGMEGSGEDEDEMEVRMEVDDTNGSTGTNKRKKGRQDDSESAVDSESENAIKENSQEGLRVIMKFKGEGVSKINPFILTKELKDIIGDSIRLKVNRNGGRVDKVKFDERILPEVRIHPLSN